MMVIRVALKIQPQHKEAFVAFVKESTPIIRQLDGCQRYAFYKDMLEESTYLLYEEWVSQADFDAFRASEHFRESGEMLLPMLAGKPDSTYFAASVVA